MTGGVLLQQSLWCIIPAFNEERAIGDVVTGAREVVPHVLVVDDGSADATAERAEVAGAEVVRHGRNLGKGHALRTGFARALDEGAQAVVMLDADGQHDPSEIPRLVAAAEAGADLVVGTRMGDTSSMPFIRLWTNRVTSAIVSWRCGQHVTDSQSGFRLIRRRVLEAVSFSTGNFDMESEMIIRTARAGFRIAEVPISTIYHQDASEGSKIRPVRDTLRFLRLVWKSFRW